MDRLLHRITGRNLTGQDRRLQELALGAPAQRHDPIEGELPLGQRAGLVGADDGGRAERLDAGQAPHEHASFRQAPGAHAEEQGEDERKFLGRRRHGDADPAEKRLSPGEAPQAAERDHRHRDCRRDDPQLLHQVAHPALKRRSRGVRLGDEAGQLSEPGGVSGGGDLAQTLAGEHDRARVEARLCRGLGRGPGGDGALALRLGLAGQRGLVDGQVGGRADHPVGVDEVALGENEEITRDQRGGVDRRLSPVPDDAGAGRHALRQLLERRPGAGLEEHVDADDRDQGDQHDHGVPTLAQQQVDRGGQDQHDGHRVEEQRRQLLEPGGPLAADQPVRSVPDQARLGLLGRETGGMAERLGGH